MGKRILPVASTLTIPLAYLPLAFSESHPRLPWVPALAGEKEPVHRSRDGSKDRLYLPSDSADETAALTCSPLFRAARSTSTTLNSTIHRTEKDKWTLSPEVRTFRSKQNQTERNWRSASRHGRNLVNSNFWQLFLQGGEKDGQQNVSY
jgi:hypothetical protein